MRKNSVEKIKNFMTEEDAVSTVEIILICVVLIALVILFKDQITSLVNTILEKATTQGKSV